MVRPSFLVIGAAKSGTTALCTMLTQHDGIYLARHKEAHYFAWSDARRPDFRGPGDQILNALAITREAEYQALFALAGGHQATGEASVYYLYWPDVAARIRASLPGVKLLVILRNPVERAYSAYLHLLREERVSVGFDAALTAEDQYVAEHYEPLWHFRRCGFYHAQLRPYFERFDRRDIAVVLFEDLKERPQAVLPQILALLGVDAGVRLDATRRVNETTSVPKHLRLRQFVKRRLSWLNRVVPVHRTERLRAALFHQRPPPLPARSAERLVEVFREDVLRLQDLLGRDLSAWLRPPAART